MGTPILLDDVKIGNLRAFAEAEENRIPFEDCLKIIEGTAPPPGDRPGYCIDLEPCWKLVYSISEYPTKSGRGAVWVRHMSMSLSRPGRVPNIITIRLICDQLGFPPFEECQISCENEIVEVIAELQ